MGSLAILAIIFGSIVIRGFDGALSEEGWLGWLSMLSFMPSLIICGYFGVRRNDAVLLFCFTAVCGTLLFMIGAISVLTSMNCYGDNCWTIVFSGFGLAAVLGFAA